MNPDGVDEVALSASQMQGMPDIEEDESAVEEATDDGPTEGELILPPLED